MQPFAFMFITVVAILIFIILATFVYGSKRGAPWIPTRKDDVERFLKLIKIEQGQTVIDLGSGDGRLLFACAKKGAIAKGYEVAILPYLVSKWRQIFSKEKNQIKIYYRDFWLTDLSSADIVYLFIMPKFQEKLKKKLTAELRPGAKIVSYVWPIEGWQEIAVDSEAGRQNLYLYQK